MAEEEIKKTKVKKSKTSVKSEKVKEKIKISQAEYEAKVMELAEKGSTSEKIGELLRRQGIHPSEYNKKISQIIREKGKYSNPDLKNVDANLKKVAAHFDKNKQDKRAKREITRLQSHLRRLRIYHKEIQLKN